MKYTVSLLLGLTMLPMAAFADTGTMSVQEHISLLQRLVAALQVELQAQLALTATTTVATTTIATSTPPAIIPFTCVRTKRDFSCGG